MIGLGFILVVFLGAPTIVYALDRRRRRRTQAELEDEAVWAAQHDEGPGSHDPITLPGPPTSAGGH